MKSLSRSSSSECSSEKVAETGGERSHDITSIGVVVEVVHVWAAS